MNKKDLINAVAEVTRTKAEASNAVDKVFKTITDEMANGESVTIVGFGTFKPVRREARKGRNPNTGEEIQIHSKMVQKFVPGKALKEAMNSPKK